MPSIQRAGSAWILPGTSAKATGKAKKHNVSITRLRGGETLLLHDQSTNICPVTHRIVVARRHCWILQKDRVSAIALISGASVVYQTNAAHIQPLFDTPH